MKSVHIYALLLLISIASARTADATSSAKVITTDLQCEYLSDPVGIDVQSPCLSWLLHDPENSRGQRQTAYQVLAARDPAGLESGHADLWDSGKVASSQSTLVPFGGPALASDDVVCWKVRVFDMAGQPSAWSPAARFTMGLLKPQDWTGPWIRHPDAKPEQHLWFRRSITLDQPLKSAFIHVASLGYHELYINGSKVDDRILAPSLTRLDKRVLYVTYDLAALLKPGKNTIALWTGPGWSRYPFFKTSFALRVQLNGRKADGQPFSLASDTTWRTQASSSENFGKTTFGDNGGETIDARKYVANWNAVDFDDSRWPAAAEASVHPLLSAQMFEPTRIIETIPARSVTGDGTAYKVDFGRNFTGWLEIHMDGLAAGDIVTIKIANEARSAQNFGQRSLYIASGQPGETFRNRFNYGAGRYVTLEGLKKKPQPADVTGYAISNDLPRIGHFACSSELFNQIYEADLWTYRANTIEGYTADCPHRERLGYGEVSFATAWGIGLPNYRSAAFYTNVVRDWSDVQEETGWINHTAPQINEHFGGPMWSSAGLNICWEHYRNFGDTRILELNYPSSKRWLEFLAAHVTDGLLRPYTDHWGKFLGDWAAPGQRREKGGTPESLYFNNCVYAMNLATFVQIANLLHKPDDAALYSQRLRDVKARIQQEFFNAERKTYSSGTQVQMAFALSQGITPDDLRPAVQASLEKDITQTHPYFDMGSSGLPVLLKYLIEDSGRSDLCFAALSKTTEPSYGYFLSRGESTWPEYWNVDVPSRIHTCYTGIASWFIKSLAGIRPDPAHPGYQSFLIQPVLAGDLSFAEATTESPYGPIASRWERKAGIVTLNVTIPPNSTATVYVPTSDAGSVKEGDREIENAEGVKRLRVEGKYAVFAVESGRYSFTAKE